MIKKGHDGEEKEVSVVSVPQGHDIREVGSDISLGEELLAPGTRLGAAQIGVCCTTGNDRVPVVRRVRVVIFSTGKEVKEIDQELAFGQIYDSNRHVLINSVNELGFCQAIDGGILPDEPQATGLSCENTLFYNIVSSCNLIRNYLMVSCRLISRYIFNIYQ